MWMDLRAEGETLEPRKSHLCKEPLPEYPRIGWGSAQHPQNGCVCEKLVLIGTGDLVSEAPQGVLACSRKVEAVSGKQEMCFAHL